MVRPRTCHSRNTGYCRQGMQCVHCAKGIMVLCITICSEEVSYTHYTVLKINHVLKYLGEATIDAEEKLKMKFDAYKALEYETQVVAGANFKIVVSSELYKCIKISHWAGHLYS